MRLDTGQHMRLSQQQKLSPRMIQSMEILQLSSQALEERIDQELASNPTLELAEPTATDPDAMQAEAKQDARDDREGERELAVRDDSVDPNHAEDFERLSNMSEEYGESWSNTYESESYKPKFRETGERDSKMDAMANTAARPASLCDQLLDQWHLVDMEDNIRVAGEFLIGFIDDDGYLRTERATILSQMPPEVNADDLDPALELIKQSIEPVGIGAANVCECLMLQIDFKIRMFDAEYDEEEILENLLKIRTLVANHLKDIEVNRLPKIAKAMDCEIDEVKTLIAMLRQFRPHPGRMLVDDSPRLIRPDAVVEFDEIEDHYVARLPSDRFPTLQISPSYEKMASDKSVERKTREFVSNNMISAKWLITAIDQRHSTLLRVISVVLVAQRDFFDQGPQHLKPLPMTSVADQLGIHVATVSRAVSEKYIQSPRGIFPLRMFFSGGTETESGDSMSWAAIQAKLEQIIEEEDKSKPYNDDQLVEKLKEKGIEIARRTVAKYRKQLNIPPARQRKEF